MKSEAAFSSSYSMDEKRNYDSSPKESAFRRLRRKFSPKKVDKCLSPESDATTESSSNGGELPKVFKSSSNSNSNSNCNELQKVFNFFDENGDGRISPSELQRCLRTAGGELSMEHAEAAVQSSDLNGDGLLDFDEFQKLMEGSSANQDEKTSELKEAFGLYVAEGSGCITPASLKTMLGKLGEPKPIDDCKAMIRAFDLNGDGVLSFEEFAIMMH